MKQDGLSQRVNVLPSVFGFVSLVRACTSISLCIHQLLVESDLGSQPWTDAGGDVPHERCERRRPVRRSSAVLAVPGAWRP